MANQLACSFFKGQLVFFEVHVDFLGLSEPILASPLETVIRVAKLCAPRQPGAFIIARKMPGVKPLSTSFKNIFQAGK